MMKVLTSVNEAIATATRVAKRDLLSAIASDYALNLEDLLAKYCPEDPVLEAPPAPSSVGSVAVPTKAPPPPPKAPTKAKAKAQAQDGAAEGEGEGEGRVPCSATNKKNKPCKRFAQPGCSLCKLHVRFFAENNEAVEDKKRVAEDEEEEPKPKANKKQKKKSKKSSAKVENDPLAQAVFDEIFEEALQPEPKEPEKPKPKEPEEDIEMTFEEADEDEDDERTVTDTDPEEDPLPESLEPQPESFDLEAMLMKELETPAVDILDDMPEPEELMRAARRTPKQPEPETMGLETLMMESLNKEDADLLAELTKAYPFSYDVEEI